MAQTLKKLAHARARIAAALLAGFAVGFAVAVGVLHDWSRPAALPGLQTSMPTTAGKDLPLPSICEAPCVIQYRFADRPESTFEGQSSSSTERPDGTWLFVSDGQSWRSEFTTASSYTGSSISYASSKKRSIWTNWVASAEREFTVPNDSKPNSNVHVAPPERFVSAHEDFGCAIFPLMTSHVLHESLGPLPIPIPLFLADENVEITSDDQGLQSATRALNDETTITVIWDDEGRTRSIAREAVVEGAHHRWNFAFAGTRVQDGMQRPQLIRATKTVGSREVASILITVTSGATGEKAATTAPVYLEELGQIREYSDFTWRTTYRKPMTAEEMTRGVRSIQDR